ncbi:MAG: DNA-binding NtrC family response regulator [Parvibaculaceae bacterium]|jgi:DNA-binding NtrC family response regulator|nr:sigma-54 dependent transcriptional regulator [Parvibaculaceae bacterium]
MRLLIVGTLNGQLSTATKMAMDKGAKVVHAESIDQAMASLRSGNGADLVMVEVSLDIARLINQLQAEHIYVPIVACGVEADAQAAVNAIRSGAKEYIPLPPDADLIAAVLAAVSEESHQMVFQDPAMGDVIKLADQIAPSEASVLITGESGSGKEVMARYVHRKSRRKEAPFISVNCAAIPENLLESELFGHEKGAFTGAVARRIGKFEEADGGTLLLDEISEIDVRLQAKLLRAIQEREIDRVGGKAPVKINIRILATSNRNLLGEVEAGTFREDLFYRLNVVNLNLLPLRERPADIMALADHFVRKYAKVNGLQTKPFTEQARQYLSNHHWSGNVRELENTMHRAILLAAGPEIDVEAIRLPDGSRLQGGASPQTDIIQQAANTAEAVSRNMVGSTVAEMEQGLIIDTLEHCLGNRTHAANILGISIRTLRNKLKQYTDQGVSVPQPGGEARA